MVKLSNCNFSPNILRLRVVSTHEAMASRVWIQASCCSSAVVKTLAKAVSGKAVIWLKLGQRKIKATVPISFNI